jgi:hypothetical protein
LATAIIGFTPRAAKISSPSSATPYTLPPGESWSKTMAPTAGSWSAWRNWRARISVLVPTPEELSSTRWARWPMTPDTGRTAIMFGPAAGPEAWPRRAARCSFS